MQHLPFASFWTLASPCLLLLSSLLSETSFLLARVHLALRLVGVYNFDLHKTLNQHTPCLYWSVIRHIKTESSIMSLTFLLTPLHTSTYLISILHQLQAVTNPPTPPTNYKSNIGRILKTLGI